MSAGHEPHLPLAKRRTAPREPMGPAAMKTQHGAIASGLTQFGRVGLEVSCDCGHVSSIEMTMPQTQILIALLQANLELAARVRDLPLPFVHEEGTA
jgi:hypothetical protein